MTCALETWAPCAREALPALGVQRGGCKRTSISLYFIPITYSIMDNRHLCRVCFIAENLRKQSRFALRRLLTKPPHVGKRKGRCNCAEVCLVAKNVVERGLKTVPGDLLVTIQCCLDPHSKPGNRRSQRGQDSNPGLCCPLTKSLPDNLVPDSSFFNWASFRTQLGTVCLHSQSL